MDQVNPVERNVQRWIYLPLTITLGAAALQANASEVSLIAVSTKLGSEARTQSSGVNVSQSGLAQQGTAEIVVSSNGEVLKLSSSSDTVTEGSFITFTLTTIQTPPGRTFTLELSGIEPSDVIGGLIHPMTVERSGSAKLRIYFASDAELEGMQTVNAHIKDSSSEVVISLHDGARVVQNAGQRLGMSNGIDSLRWLPDKDLDDLFADYAELGVQWFRFDLAWSVVQKADPDSYDWAQIDRIVSGANRHGIQLLACLTFAPKWVRTTGGLTSSENIAAFANFSAKAVARYNVNGINSWEIWNEPNLKTFWETGPDPAVYTNVLKAAYTAIKSVDPTSTVIAGGLSPARATDKSKSPSRWISARSFLSEMYANGAKDHFDAIGFHPYSAPLMPSSPAPWSGWQMMASTSPNLRSIMTANGDAGKKIWITEYGAATNEPVSEVSEQKQARMLQEAYDLAGGYAWAGPLFWYSYRDRGTNPADKEDWFGLISASNTKKPAYETYRSITGSKAGDVAPAQN
ncbi:cellulase family glycosylhydrolase [Microvirga aerilata]|uniref:Cellulase family glycosylhydrolase n=1 Tax=Microvirga aerilata TaxID=670292 RepID=A0A936ZN67_9HYPH|nr:cellulase family glycosylhydrolase [Microvirga aerilata]MBL0407663.1 cellulase family glycosylhydrolase [Microvirga aerilata]